jgi:hypothetical protein
MKIQKRGKVTKSVLAAVVVSTIFAGIASTGAAYAAADVNAPPAASKITSVAEAQSLVNRGSLENANQPLAKPGQTSTEALNERYQAELYLIAHNVTPTRNAKLATPQTASSPYSRTCTVVFGSGNTQPWNTQKAANCAGTVKYYYHGVYQGFLNMVRFLASQGSKPLNQAYEALNSWCGSNSILCSLASGFIFLGVGLLLG